MELLDRDRAIPAPSHAQVQSPHRFTKDVDLRIEGGGE